MQKRIIVLVLLSVAVVLSALWLISHLSINDSINRSLEDRLKLANIVSNYINTLLQDNLTRLYDISLSGDIDLNDGDWETEKKAMKAAYQYSIFTDGIFLLDLNGNIVLTYPLGRHKENLLSIPYVKEAIEKREAVISDVYTIPETRRNVIFVLAPLRGAGGDMIGLAGGEINPTNYMLNSVIKAIPAGVTTDIELVDSRGTVIASNDPKRVFTCIDHNKFLSGLIAAKKTAVATCHHCHTGDEPPHNRTTEMLAFSPLSDASWGVSVREPEAIVFAPSTRLKKNFLLLAVISMGSALLLAVGMSSSIVRPIKSLIAATKRIADGNLSEPVRVVSSNEIGSLSESFETMRIGLSESLYSIQKHNVELEKRVDERTAELLQNRKRLAMLLDEIIEAQEEERKRVARELHDETSQLLAALGMSIDMAAMAHKKNNLTVDGIYELKQKVGQALDGINLIIRDLRPPVLDDLGMESAIRWLLERHLAEKGISYSMVSTEGFKNLMPGYGKAVSAERKTELMIFRVVQEAVTNIAKHSSASNVFVALDAGPLEVNIAIEDDGMGFDAREALEAAERGEDAGFGILGMKERAALMGGGLTICSRPGEGASISVRVPWASTRGIYA
ncbi:MAG: cache domain-containing protein [Thermodesulfovibrionales bacterium]|nr:cache domain-containing protein [Thermodesulfovibrionales bacterium]